MSADKKPSGALFPGVNLDCPIRTVVWVAAIAVLAVLITIVIPGLVACGSYQSPCPNYLWTEKALGKELESLPARKNIDEETWKRWEKYKAQLEQINLAIASSVSPQETNDLEKQKSLLLLKPPIRILPFQNHFSQWDWVDLAYLGWLVILARPPYRNSGCSGWQRWWPIIPGAFIIDAIRSAPHYMRNFWLNSTDTGRTVFAYPNWDIHPPSFITQEFTQFVSSLLIAMLWAQWLAYLALLRNDLARINGQNEPVSMALNPQKIEILSTAYIHWQIASILLIPPFILGTWFYWDLVGQQSGDYRYFPSAVIMLAIYIISWILVSLPLLVGWYDWHLCRTKALCKLGADSNPEGNRMIEAIKALQPVPLWSLIGTSIAGVAALLIPVLDLLLKIMRSG